MEFRNVPRNPHDGVGAEWVGMGQGNEGHMPLLFPGLVIKFKSFACFKDLFHCGGKGGSDCFGKSCDPALRHQNFRIGIVRNMGIKDIFILVNDENPQGQVVEHQLHLLLGTLAVKIIGDIKNQQECHGYHDIDDFGSVADQKLIRHIDDIDLHRNVVHADVCFNERRIA